MSDDAPASEEGRDDASTRDAGYVVLTLLDEPAVRGVCVQLARDAWLRRLVAARALRRVLFDDLGLDADCAYYVPSLAELADMLDVACFCRPTLFPGSPRHQRAPPRTRDPFASRHVLMRHRVRARRAVDAVV